MSSFPIIDTLFRAEKRLVSGGGMIDKNMGLVSPKDFIKVHGLLCLLAAATLLVLAKDGNTSQVMLKEVNLEALVNLSDAVLVVSKMNPDIAFKVLPVDTTGIFPPYKRLEYRFDAVETLINWSEVEATNGPIIVMEANDENQYQSLKDQYLGLPPKSPVYFSYNSGIRYDQISRPFIVFLKARSDGQFELSVQYAFESIRKKDAVSKLIAKRSQSKSPIPRQ
jgi:hypothetical protein